MKKTFYFSNLRKVTNILLIVLMSLSATVWGEASWKVSLKDADIRVFIAQVSEMTERSFIIDPRVKAKVTVISTAEMNSQEVYELLLSVLNVYGFAAVPAGEFIKIVPASGAKSDTIEFVKSKKLSKGQSLVTHVIPVENTPALELVPILRPMVPQYGHLAGVASANALIITDHADNIVRIIDIIKRLDSAESEELEVIQLEEAWVGDVVELLQSLTPVETGSKKSTRNSAARVKVVADERTNRLIVKGEKSARARVRVLVARLDQPSEHAGSTSVIYLRHAEAIKVSEIIEALVGGGGSSGAGGKSGTSLPNSDINIQADETLNAIVVRAQPSDIAEIKELVEQLDVRRAQVLIEAAIVEVSGDVGEALGIQWAAVDNDFDTPVAGVNFTNLGNSLNSVIATLQGAATGGGLAEGITIAGGERSGDGNSGYGVLLQALANASNTNLLSTPSIMTLDNEEAEIIVGQNVPFITGSSTSTNSGVDNPFQTISREDVGLTLKVAPQINEGDVIRLQVEQEVSAVVPSAEGIDAADLITNTRSIKTTILADEGETIVLGGLIQDDFTDSESKVPLLGDIPVLGRLFKSKRRSHVKRNLLVFLRPSIVRDAGDMRDITERKYQHMRTLELSVDKGGSLFRWKDSSKDSEALPENLDEIYNRKVIAP